MPPTRLDHPRPARPDGRATPQAHQRAPQFPLRLTSPPTGDLLRPIMASTSLAAAAAMGRKGREEGECARQRKK